VIHDLGNVLTVASMRADMLTGENDLTTASDEMTQVLRYGTKLLGQLRDFCEDREPATLVDAASTLSAMQPVLSALVGGRDTLLRFTCEQAPVQLNMAKVELEQMVLNLCMNAKDAIEAGGWIEVRVRRANGYLELTVQDNGRGMDEATQTRLFEPFFTTKQGHSGIGLAAVYGIVERVRGRIDVSSELGKGTKFTVHLPLVGGGTTALDHPWSF
jgi:signal transduction histidine kinase